MSPSRETSELAGIGYRVMGIGQAGTWAETMPYHPVPADTETGSLELLDQALSRGPRVEAVDGNLVHHVVEVRPLQAVA